MPLHSFQNLPAREGYEQRASTHAKVAKHAANGWKPRAAVQGQSAVELNRKQVVGNRSIVLLERALPKREAAK